MTNYIIFLKGVRRVSENTIKAVKADLKSLAEHTNPETATRQDIEDWILSQENLSPATVRRRVISVKQYYDWMIANGYYKLENPAASAYLVPKQEEKEARELVNRDKILEEAKNDTDALAIGLMAWCGLRISEAVAAHTKDISDDGWLTVIGKGNKKREVPLVLLPEKAIEAYKRITADGDTYLLKGERGPLTANGLWRRLKPIEPHDLRRAALTAQVMGGANLESVRRLAGHKSLSILHQYMVEDKNKMLKGLKQ